eukprot:gene14507-5567_t
MADEIAGFPKLKVDDLKRELQKRGLPVKGTKAELQERLLEYLKKDVALDSEEHNDKSEDGSDDKNDSDVDNNELEHSVEEEEDLDVATVQELDDVLEVKVPEVEIKDVQPKENTSDQKNEAVKPAVVKKNIPQTEEEKRTARGKRFGEISNEVDKKKLRAERFQAGGAEEVVFKGKHIAGDELEKLKKRANRFGAVSPVIEKLGENERKVKRQQRFGIVTSVSTVPSKDNLDVS